MALENQLDNLALFNYHTDPGQLTPTQRMVLLGIFKHRNNCTFKCFPSINRIATCTSLNRKTVMITIDELVRTHRLIRIQEGYGKRVTKSHYYSPWDFWEAKEIAENEDSVFYKAGGDDIFQKAVEIYDNIPPF